MLPSLLLLFIHDANAKQPRANLRAGVSLASVTPSPSLSQAPSLQICGELRLWSKLSVEGCGNGLGVFQNTTLSDIAHFRAKWSLWQKSAGSAVFASGIGVGFTELQRGPDKPGFLFGSAAEDQTEAAGPELSASFSSRQQISKDVYMLIDLSAGLSHIPGAPIVMGSESPTMLFTAATVGIGF